MTDQTMGISPDRARIAVDIVALAENSQRVIQSVRLRQIQDGSIGNFDPFNIAKALTNFTRRISAGMEKMIHAQTALWVS